MRDRIAWVFSEGRSARLIRTSSMVTPKPAISVFTSSLIAAMIRSRSAESTSSRELRPMTRRSEAVTIEFRRPRMLSGTGPTA